MSPCRAPTLKPCFCSDLYSSATSRLRLQKMIAFCRSLASRSRRRSVSRFSCGSRPTLTWNWDTPVAVVAGLETSTFSGLCRKVSVMRRISGGIVDHKQFDAGEKQTAALGVVEQPAGRCDQNVDPACQLGVLIAERNAADQKGDIEFLTDAIFVET